MSSLTWERTDTAGELLVSVNSSTGPESGATVVVRVRDGETPNSYLDFADGLFKTAGHTTIDGVLTEVTASGTSGHYRRALDLTSITLPATNRLIAEYRVTAPTGFPQAVDTIQLVNHYQDVAISTDILSDATPFQGADIPLILVDTANLDATISSRESEASALARATTIQADVAALNDLSIADVQTALTNQGYTAARAILLDNLDAAITTRAVAGDAMSLTAAAIDLIWDELQAGHVTVGSFGSLLDAAISSRSSHSAADVDTVLSGTHGAGSWASLSAADVDAIWDELLAGHVIVGSAGEALAAASGGGDPAAIADAVWDELQAGHLTANTFGAFLNAAITSLQTEITAAARAVADQASHTQTQADVAALNDLSIADVQAGLTAQGYTAARAPLLDDIITRESEAAALARAVTDQASHTTTQAAVALNESEASALARATTDQAAHTTTQAAIAALNDPTTAAIVAGILAGIVDGTVDLGTVLTRVNAFIRGRVVRDDVSSLIVDVEYYDEADTTKLFENRKTTALRTPQ